MGKFDIEGICIGCGIRVGHHHRDDCRFKKKRLSFKKRQHKMLMEKTGGRCEFCGSEFELTIHHEEYEGLNHNQKVVHPVAKHKVKLICITCHEMEDYQKNMACAMKGMMKKYDEQCAKMKKKYEVEER
jgi:hypothetical protein